MSGSQTSDLVVATDASGFAGVYGRSGIPEHLVARVRALGAPPGPTLGLVAAFAGELDDGGELARELMLDTPVSAKALVAHAYVRWGKAMVERLRGSFGCLAWDPARREGILAVDALGSGSVYVFEREGWLAFASDVRLLMHVLPRRPPPDAIAVAQWLASSPLPDGATLHSGVTKLPGGTRLWLRDGPTREVYWMPVYRDPFDLDEESACAMLWDALVDSVARRTNDESVAIVMSGGVDSSAVASAALQASSNGRVRGYSAVFPGHPHRRVDESERIDRLVTGIGLPSVQIRIAPSGALSHAADWIRAWGLPLASPGYMLERPLLEAAAADRCTVVLDGQGGDELFAAASFLLADLLARGRLGASLRLARRLPGVNHSRRTIATALLAYSSFALPLGIQGVLARLKRPGPGLQQWLKPDVRRAIRQAGPEWRRELDGPRWWSQKAHLLTRAREQIGVGEYLRQRAATSGLRARPPLLDEDLVEVALRIPPALEFDPQFDRPLIRRAMAGRVPDEVRLSTLKSNLAPFYIQTVAGAELPAIRRLLGDPGAEVYAFTDRAKVGSMLAGPPVKADVAASAWEVDVWKLAVAELWLRGEEGPEALDRLVPPGSLAAPRTELYRRRDSRRPALAR